MREHPSTSTARTPRSLNGWSGRERRRHDNVRIEQRIAPRGRVELQQPRGEPFDARRRMVRFELHQPGSVGRSREIQRTGVLHVTGVHGVGIERMNAQNLDRKSVV